MFTRFDKDQRAAIFAGATEEARRASDGRLAPTHLFVAIAAAGGAGGATLAGAGIDADRVRSLADAVRARSTLRGLDAEALAAVGIDLDAVRERADAVFGPGSLERAGRPGRGRKPSGLTREGKDALRDALLEARRHKDSVIDSGHLLLGVLANPDPVLREVLDAAEVDPDAIATSVRERLDVTRKAA